MTWLIALILVFLVLYLIPLRMVRLHRRGKLTASNFTLTFAVGWCLASSSLILLRTTGWRSTVDTPDWQEGRRLSYASVKRENSVKARWEGSFARHRMAIGSLKAEPAFSAGCGTEQQGLTSGDF